MQGVGIFNDDILIVDRYVTPGNQDVIMANFNGDFVCKILDTPRRLLLSANETVQAVPIHDYDTFTIEGVVIRSIRCHRPSYLLVEWDLNMYALVDANSLPQQVDSKINLERYVW